MTDARDVSRIVLRPIANPLPMGLLGLAVAALAVTGLQLDWVPDEERNVIGFALLGFVAPLQLASALLAFVGRDDVVAAGMSVQGATHLVIGIDLLVNPVAGKSDALGLFLVLAALALLPAVAAAAFGKVVPALAMASAMVHFGLDGIARFTETAGWENAAGAVGIEVGAVALYAATALILEDVADRTVLPLGRRGESREALRGGLGEQLDQLPSAPGVRESL